LDEADDKSIKKAVDKNLITEVKNDIWGYMRENDVNYYELFLEIDKNQNQKISKEEFKTFLKKRLRLNITEDRLNKVVDYFDIMNDGIISLEELKKNLTRSN